MKTSRRFLLSAILAVSSGTPIGTFAKDRRTMPETTPTAVRLPQYDALEKRLSEFPVIAVPTITLEGDANGAPHHAQQLPHAGAKEVRMKRVVIAMLALSALAAEPAHAQAVISSEGVTERYSREELSTAADRMEFLVEVRGMPFAGTTREAFERMLIDVLTAARPPHPATRFTVRPTTADVDRAYRLVMVFGPARNLAFETQCRALDSAQFEPVAAGEVKVSVAFCRKDELLSHAVASVSATDFSDPGFRQMFAELLPRLFPANNPLLDGGK